MFQGANDYRTVEAAAKSLGLTVNELMKDFSALAVVARDPDSTSRTSQCFTHKDGTFPVTEALKVLSNGHVVGSAFAWIKAKREEARLFEANRLARERLRAHAEQVLIHSSTGLKCDSIALKKAPDKNSVAAASQTLSLAEKLKQLNEAKDHITPEEYQVVRMVMLENFTRASRTTFSSEIEREDEEFVSDECRDVTLRYVTPTRQTNFAKESFKTTAMPETRTAPAPIVEKIHTLEDLLDTGSRHQKMPFVEALARVSQIENGS